MIDHFAFSRPVAPLQPFVKNLWVIRGSASQEEPYWHRALVDGCTQLLVATQGGFQRQDDGGRLEPLSRAALVAQSTVSRSYRLTEPFEIFGVCFYPFSIPFLFDVPGMDFIDRSFPPQAIFGAGYRAFERRLQEAADQSQALHAINQGCIDLLPGVRKPEPSVLDRVRQLFGCEDAESLSRLSKPDASSARQFQRQLKRYTGFTPKQLMRILRLQQALQSDSSSSLVSIATRSDYFDQAHFTYEFKRLTGVTPAPFYAGARPDTRWHGTGKEVAFFQSGSKRER